MKLYMHCDPSGCQLLQQQIQEKQVAHADPHLVLGIYSLEHWRILQHVWNGHEPVKRQRLSGQLMSSTFLSLLRHSLKPTLA